MRYGNFIALAFVLFCSSNAFSEEEAPCSSVFKDIPFHTATATASMLDNMRNKKGSLKYETNLMFANAKKKIAELKAPSDLCPDHCKTATTPYFVFSSVPSKFLTQYGDANKCAGLLKKTKAAPITYSDRAFASLDAFNAWYNDFSQGKGTDGKDLYRQCDGSCSPQYQTLLQGMDNNLKVTAKVVCGQARDKNDNTYQLKSSFRWVCK